MNFQGAHILSINQFEKQDVTRIFDVADQMQPYALRKKVTRVLEGAILGNMFFPSFLAKTKREQLLPGHIHGKFWPQSLQFAL